MNATAEVKEQIEEIGTVEQPRLTIWRYLQSQNEFNALFALKLPYQLKFALRQVRAELVPQLEQFNETRAELAEDFEIDATGKTKNAARQAEMDAAFADLLNQSLALNAEKIPESLFGDKISAQESEILNWLVQENI